jgi:ribosomal protein S12 methylthiotransferase accessory factor
VKQAAAAASPIVFLGPSLPWELARRCLPDADYRPPVRRGDLDGIAPGTVVGVIDGVFDQSLAISPGEIREAIGRGVAVYGAASMGALRAAEVRQVIGVGRVFEMYASGEIDRDDEVAVLFDPQTLRPLTDPLVNLRHAVARLVKSATLSRENGEALLAAGEALHYTERTYRAVVANSPLAKSRDADELVRLLGTFDLKRDDALFLLETIAAAEAPVRSQPQGSPSPGPMPQAAAEPVVRRVRDREEHDAPVLVWESGDQVRFADLVRFLKLTGRYQSYARNALARSGIRFPDGTVAGEATQDLLDEVRVQWGWESSEEAHVTMRDLGIGLRDAADALHAEAVQARVHAALAQRPTAAFDRALRCELWMNELALKREVLRLGAWDYFARRGAESGPPTDAELDGARRCLARLRGTMQWYYVLSDLKELGVAEEEVEAAVHNLALARRAAAPVAAAMCAPATVTATAPGAVTATAPGAGTATAPGAAGRVERWRRLGLAFESSPKAPGSLRFGLGEAEAVEQAERIAKQMGVVRIGLVGQLSTLGVHVAQAFGERSGWSSSFSSGKSETRDGARVGSIMEEAELHAQDAFALPRRAHVSYAEGAGRLPLIDPKTLGLPYDSRYRDDLELDWSPCADLIGGGEVLVPSACLTGERLPHDVLYSPRLGGKIFSSSGLGSGFSLAEAAVHATAECIERHAQRLAELTLDNPGGVGGQQFWFVDEESVPATPRRIIGKYHAGGMLVRILDMTSDIAVPAFYARIFEDPFGGQASTSSDGFACHPDPEVALTMALLEAAQTKAGFIAGGREDYSLQARSLGRHERPRTAVTRSQVFWFGNDRPVRPFNAGAGLRTGDLLTELEWIADRIAAAGYPHLLVTDLTMPRIRPAYAVRVLIPGTETTNPLCTGERGRATCIRDLLPWTST